MRFSRFELVTTNSGLDSEDGVRFVNRLLARFGMFDVEFDYDDSARQASRNAHPVCIVHFPHVIAESPDACREHCEKVAERLLLAMALTRDAPGAVFDVVVVPHETGAAVKYAVVDSYVGNALVGNLAGENFASVDAYIRGLEANEMNRFIVGLYHQARRERSRDYQYVRFWQILETIADSQDYDPAHPLLNFEGAEMRQASRRLLLDRSAHRVFNLLRENGLGTTDSTWSSVLTWNAMRDAVAHFGAIARFERLRNTEARQRCQQAIAEIGEIDHHLLLLRDSTKLVLMRTLVRAAEEDTSQRSR